MNSLLVETRDKSTLYAPILYWSGARHWELLQYPKKRADFKLPAQYVSQLRHRKKFRAQHRESAQSNRAIPELAEDDEAVRSSEDLENLRIVRSMTSIRAALYNTERIRAEQELYLERNQSLLIIAEKTNDGLVLVDWYTTDDPANPQNWPSFKNSVFKCPS
jgi:DHA1 family multidrug resistance protein-like MFS transporter